MNDTFRTVKERVTSQEWEARVDLAACYRLIAHFGMSDLVYNHITCRVPGSHSEFLINPYGMMYEEITASSLIKIDLDGKVLLNGNETFGVNEAGYVIHSAIHRHRHDVDCVIHTHTRAGMAVSALACGLLPLAQTSMRFASVAYHEYEGVAVDLDEQERLVDDLGDNDVMILRNHGLLAVGKSVAEAINAMYFGWRWPARFSWTRSPVIRLCTCRPRKSSPKRIACIVPRFGGHSV